MLGRHMHACIERSSTLTSVRLNKGENGNLPIYTCHLVSTWQLSILPDS